MNDPANQPETLVSVPNEFEAAMIVSALAARDIDASTAGSFTAGFRAEAPGDVEVVVRQRDLERAKTALNELRPHAAHEIPSTAREPGSQSGHGNSDLAGLRIARVAGSRCALSVAIMPDPMALPSGTECPLTKQAASGYCAGGIL